MIQKVCGQGMIPFHKSSTLDGSDYASVQMVPGLTHRDMVEDLALWGGW